MLRKTAFVAADGGAFGWARLFVQDARALTYAQSAGDVVVRLAADNRRLPAVVNQIDESGIDLAVLLPLPVRGTAQQVYIDLGDAGEAAPASFGTFGELAEAPIATIDAPQTVYTGEGETGSSIADTTAFVHPSICRVPAGSWAKHLDGTLGGEVTHLIADTPYPSSNDDYENPVLFYSTDNCQSRQPVPSASIPWPLDTNPGSPSNKDASAFFDPVSGDLIVAWLGGGSVKYARISGTHLSNAAVDEEWSTDAADLEVSGQFAVSPSYLPISDSIVRVYYVSPGPVESAGAGSIHYRETTNFGSASTTWGDPVTVAYSGGEFDRGWWHGEICHDGKGGPFSDGYWYLIYNETLAGDIAGASDVAHARLFRSRSIDGPWEPAIGFAMKAGSGIAPDAVYKPSLGESEGGAAFILASGRDGSSYAVGWSMVDLANSTATEAEAFNHGWSGSAYAESSPLLLGLDLQRGTLDASESGNAVTLVGSPTEAEGTGVTFNGSDQYAEIGAAQVFAAADFLDVEIRATFPASFTTAAPTGYLLSEVVWSSFDYSFRVPVNTSTGKVKDWYFKTAAGATYGVTGDVGPDLRGGTHTIRMIFDPANGYAKLMIDGATWSTQTSVSGVLRTVASSRLVLGAAQAGNAPIDCTVHYVQVRGGAGADYTAYRPSFGYTGGSVLTAVAEAPANATRSALVLTNRIELNDWSDAKAVLASNPNAAIEVDGGKIYQIRD